VFDNAQGAVPGRIAYDPLPVRGAAIRVRAKRRYAFAYSSVAKQNPYFGGKNDG
jgi:hypothetical protein